MYRILANPSLALALPMKGYINDIQKKSLQETPPQCRQSCQPVVLLVAAFLDLPLQLRRSLGRLILQVILQGRRGATRQLFPGDLDADPTTLRARALPECLGNAWGNMGKYRVKLENPWKIP